MDNIQELSKKWNVKVYSIRNWMTKYKEKLNIENIIVAESVFLNNYVKIVKERNTVKLIYIQKKNRLKDLDLNKNEENIIQLLSIKWKISRYAVKSWIKRNANQDFYSVDELLNNQNVQIITPENFDLSFRFEDVSIITNKKQVLALSKKWNTSVNGAKKWIRNNLPDKFKEIYDDKHLERNKKKVFHEQKINYLESLEENFNEQEAMKFLNINKTTLYAQIKAHNPNLLEKLHNKHLCPKCNYKNRSNGQYRRCLDCNHNFKPDTHLQMLNNQIIELETK